MLVLGLLTLVFALLPLPLLSSGLASEIVWSISSLLLASFGLWYVVWVWGTARRDPSVNMLILGVAELGSAASTILVGFNAWGPQTFWPYLTALVWFQCLSAFLFFRVLRVWLSGRV
jgi:hypothetical protein